MTKIEIKIEKIKQMILDSDEIVFDKSTESDVDTSDKLILLINLAKEISASYIEEESLYEISADGEKVRFSILSFVNVSPDHTKEHVYEIDMWSNFCRVFKTPMEFPDGYCFNGPKPVDYKMVDSFNPYDIGSPAVSKEMWVKEVGEIEIIKRTDSQVRKHLEEFLLQKFYIEEGVEYLVVCNFGCSFVIKR